MLFTSNLLRSAMLKYVKRYLTTDRNSTFISGVKCIFGQYTFRLSVINDTIIMWDSFSRYPAELPKMRIMS